MRSALSVVSGVLRGCMALGAAFLALPANASEQQSSLQERQWNPWVEWGGVGGNDDGRGIIEFWSPLMQSQTALFFFDGRFQFIEDSVQEGNAQFGLRKMSPSGWNLGAWGSIDVRETSEDNTFWQIAGGLEALSVKWDLRLNGYLPVTDPQTSPSTAEVILKRNNIFMIGGEEVALYGFDGEIGYLLFGSPETKPGTRYELRAYGGGFWFDHSDAIDDVAGPSARVELRLDNLIPDWGGSRLTFDAGWSHDEIRDDVWEAGARVRIPLGGLKTYALLSPQARRMQERIERDDDIVVVQSGPEKVFDTLTGVRFDRVAYVDPSITDASAQAGNNSLLIVNGEVTGPQELQGNQTLQGGKSTILVTGLKSGATTSFTAPGARATINGTVGPDLTLLGSNTHVAGFDITGGDIGILGGDGKRNIVLEQLDIFQVAASGIVFGSNNRALIQNVELTSIAGTGISFGGDNDVVIRNTVLSFTGGSGINFNSGNDVTLHSIALTSIAGTGINFNSNNDVVIQSAALSSTGGTGINFNSDNAALIRNATLTSIAGTGINFNSNNEVGIHGAVLSSTGGSGINFNLDNTVTIQNVELTSIAGTGIDFNSNNEATIRNATLNSVGGMGIQFNLDNRFDIRDVAMTSVASFGIDFNSDNEAAIQNVAFSSIGNDAISFNLRNEVEIQNATMTSIAGSGIRANSENEIHISDVEMTTVGNFGIVFNIENNVTIQNAALSSIATNGIDFNSDNLVSIADTTIANVGNDGISFNASNTVALNDSALAGAFGGDGVAIGSPGNTLSGTGNTAAGATFGGTFCDAAAGQTGSFAFVDNGSGNPGTCPP